MEAGRGSQACTFSEKGGEERGSLSWITVFLLRCHKSSDTPSTEVIPRGRIEPPPKARPVLHRLLTLERQVFSCS